jgi:hypothetical protein
VFQTEMRLGPFLARSWDATTRSSPASSAEPDDFDPILLEVPEDVVIASDWAGGFLDAVALRETAWEPLIESDGAAILMTPLFLLNGDMEIDDCFRPI